MADEADEEKQGLLRHSDDVSAAQLQSFTQGYREVAGSLSPSLLNKAPSPITAIEGYRALDECLDAMGEGPFQHRLLLLLSFGNFVSL
jgi:hypothetical protein